MTDSPIKRRTNHFRSPKKTACGETIFSALYEDEDGALWIGKCDSGLSRFKDWENLPISIKENGLFSNGVFIHFARRIAVTFGCRAIRESIASSRAELNDFADGTRRNITSTSFGKSDGMLSD